MLEMKISGLDDSIQVLKKILLPWVAAQEPEREKRIATERTAQRERLEADLMAQEAKEKREAAEREADSLRKSVLIARADESKARALVYGAQAEKLRAEVEQMQKQQRLEMIKLGLEIVKTYAPNVPEEEKLQYVMRLLPDLEVLVSGKVKFRE